MPRSGMYIYSPGTLQVQDRRAYPDFTKYRNNIPFKAHGIDKEQCSASEAHI